nr:PREDICTED: ras-related protein Rab-7L1-like [Lepisosteus oculatus]
MPLDHLLKVIVLGRSQVGKTSFVQQYVSGHFKEGYKVTIGVDFAMKTMEWSDDQIIRLQFWDIQGQEDTLPMTRAFYKDADGCILMFDLTNDKSFKYCKLLKQAVDTEIPTKDGHSLPCILLGNKCDLTNRVMTSKDVADLSNSLQCIAWKEISVKENRHVEESVRCILEAIMEKRTVPNEPVLNTIEDIPKTPPRHRSCCKT